MSNNNSSINERIKDVFKKLDIDTEEKRDKFIQLSQTNMENSSYGYSLRLNNNSNMNEDQNAQLA